MTRVLCAAHVIPIAAPPLRDGAIAYADGAILAVGPRNEVLEAHPGAEIDDLGAMIVLPGLVNAHTHLEYAAYAGFGDGLPFGPWLADHVSRRPRLQPGDVEAAAALGAHLALASGATTVGDASYSGAAVAAVAAEGLRAIVHLEVFGGPDADPATVIAALGERLDALHPDLPAHVAVAISPHSPYSVAPAVMAALADEAGRRDCRLMIHAAESSAELDAVASGTGPIADALAALTRVEGTGAHPIDLLERCGALSRATTLVHGVHVGSTEIAIVAAAGSAVVHCPRSNALLGCGIAPVRAYLDAGVPMGLGSDSPASALDFDLWAEMRAALLLARAGAGRPDVLTAADVLAMATSGGAQALGLGSSVGRLAPGYRADLLAVDLSTTAFDPVEDPVRAVVLGGAPEHVQRVIVDGVLRYRREDGAERRAALLEAARPGRARMIADD